MSSQSKMLNDNPLPWLLEPDVANPGIRYFSLHDLLRRSKDDPELRQAKVAIITHGPLPIILAAQIAITLNNVKENINAALSKPIPAAPTLHNIINSDLDGDFDVSWSASDGAASYQVQEQKNSADCSQIYAGRHTNLTCTGVEVGNWCYQVHASNGSGSSDWSASQCTTVDVAPITPIETPCVGSTWYNFLPVNIGD